VEKRRQYAWRQHGVVDNNPRPLVVTNAHVPMRRVTFSAFVMFYLSRRQGNQHRHGAYLNGSKCRLWGRYDTEWR